MFKGKYEARPEFPGGWGWGLQTKNLSWEGYGYFLQQHNEVSLAHYITCISLQLARCDYCLVLLLFYKRQITV